MTAYPGNASTYTQPPAGPATHGWAVTASDSAPLTNPALALYVGTTGDVAVVLANVAPGATAPKDNAVVFHAVPAGTFLNICATYVLSTGTTASNIVALW